MTTRIPAFRPTVTPTALQLEILDGPDAGQRTIVRGARARVGTAAPCEVILTDATVSRVHCAIEVAGDGVVLRDLDSTNGTVVAGCRVTHAYLAPGAVFRVGRTAIRIDDGPGRAAGVRVTGPSAAMRRLDAEVQRVAASDAPVLITGETGTGKELVAEAIHQAGRRASGPFVVLDCGRIAASMIEAELFGHVRGAFTGAVGDRPGLIESAHGGTLLLDEIGELPLELQHKLLGVLERRVVSRLGAHQPTRVDVRILAATHRDLAAEVKAGRFRADLRYRLDVLALQVPPLRERLDDLEALATHFLRQASGDPDATVPSGLLAELRGHAWPGNVRELRAVIERTVLGGGALRATTAELDPTPDAELPFRDAKALAMDAWERRYLAGALRRTRGNIAHAARAAQMSRAHLYELLRRHGLTEPE